MSIRRRRRFLSRVALVAEAEPDTALRGFLYLLGAFADLGALLLVGGSDQPGEPVTERVHG